MASIGNLYASLNLKSASFENGLRRASSHTRKAQSEMERSFGGIASTATKSFAMITAAAGAVGFGALLGKIAQVNTEYQKLNGMLLTATGSTENAAQSMAMLQKFAATTPFSLQEVTNAFVKLKNLGLNPSAEALKSYGNTASAMGKDLNQLIEAVADASTNEFERLKEFGIKSKQEGDKVSFTFQGVTTIVEKNANEIQKYLLGLGNVQFAGAMERQSRTLGGALSNLGDTAAQMAVKFGEAGFAPALEAGIRALEASAGSVENFAVKLGTLTGNVLGTAVQGFTILANNIDTIARVAGIAATVIASRYAVALGVTAVAAARQFVVANTAAIAGMLAYARVAPVVGTATIALTGLRAAAMGVLAIFGGPWGVAIAAAVTGAALLYQRIQENTSGQKELAEAAARVAPIKDKVREASERLASSMGQTRKEALASARALREETVQLIKNTEAKLRNSQARILQLQTERSENMFKNSRSVVGAGGGFDPVTAGRRFDTRRIEGEQRRAQALLQELDDLNKMRKKIEKDIAAATVPDVPTVGSVGGGGGGGRGGGSAADKAKQDRERAREYLEDLKFQGEQLRRNANDQEVFNNLRQAGVTIESELGRAIAAQTIANQQTKLEEEKRQKVADTRDEYRKLTEELGLNERELALLNAERLVGNQILEDGTIIVDGNVQALKREINAYYDQKDALEAVRKAAEALREEDRKRARDEEARLEALARARMQIGRDIADIGIKAFDGLIKGSMTFGDAFRGIITDLGQLMLETLVYAPLRELAAQLASQATKGLIGSLFKTAAGAAVGANSSALPVNVAPVGRALGGPVSAGRATWVGERGPEMFVPDRAGMIVPNRNLQGGNSNITIAPSYNIQLSGNRETDRQTLAEIKKAQADQAAFVRAENQRRSWRKS